MVTRDVTGDQSALIVWTTCDTSVVGSAAEVVKLLQTPNSPH
ncbi:hypothetical protein T07_10867 [Trichinella nelsoni]|uniref:Uncharacterized protein n=1 Tax=Trichinella nelsoni TaxID=6336 RepID=A0A0V0SLD1_9BILA|nr:hypothetical protein T07_10867 [Trichinella nelsoni]